MSNIVVDKAESVNVGGDMGPDPCVKEEPQESIDNFDDCSRTEGPKREVIYLRVLKSEDVSESEDEVEEDKGDPDFTPEDHQEEVEVTVKRKRKPRARKISVEEVRRRRNVYVQEYNRKNAEKIRARRKTYKRNRKNRKKLTEEQRRKAKEWWKEYAQRPEVKQRRLEKARIHGRAYRQRLSEEKKKEIRQRQCINALIRKSQMTEEEIEEKRRKDSMRRYMAKQAMTPEQREEYIKKKGLKERDQRRKAKVGTEEWVRMRREWKQKWVASLTPEEKADKRKKKQESEKRRMADLEKNDPERFAEYKRHLKELKRSYYHRKKAEALGIEYVGPQTSTKGLGRRKRKDAPKTDEVVKRTEETTPVAATAASIPIPDEMPVLNLNHQEAQLLPSSLSSSLLFASGLPLQPPQLQPYYVPFQPVPPTIPAELSSYSSLYHPDQVAAVASPISEPLSEYQPSLFQAGESFDDSNSGGAHAGSYHDDYDDGNNEDCAEDPVPLPRSPASFEKNGNGSSSRSRRIQTRQVQKRVTKLARDQICHICSNFYPKNYLPIHMNKTHHPDFKDGKCTQCFQSFRTGTEFYHHWTKNHKHDESLRTFICDLCGKTYPNKGCLAVHKSRKHSTKPKNPHKLPLKSINVPSKCILCEEKFNDAEAVKGHVRESHPESYWICHCGILRYTEASLKYHQERNCKEEVVDEVELPKMINKTKAKCDICTLQLSSVSLSEHYLKQHEVTEEPFKCWDCPKQFRLRWRWIYHMIREHALDWREWVDHLNRFNGEDKSKAVLKPNLRTRIRFQPQNLVEEYQKLNSKRPNRNKCIPEVEKNKILVISIRPLTHHEINLGLRGKLKY